jgi:hypothetical protein
MTDEDPRTLGELIAARNNLMAQLEAQGGRGVDLAERIDKLDAEIEAAQANAT